MVVMASVTDWLTSIGTVAAVVISLSYAVVGHYTEKARRRKNLIHRVHAVAERLFEEIEGAPVNQSDINNLETYGTFRLYRIALTLLGTEANDDVITLADDVFTALVGYFNDRSDTRRTACQDLISQIDRMK